MRCEKPIVRRHQKLGITWICYDRYTWDGELWSDICGNKDCVRLQHIKYQAKREDIKDKKHHKDWPGSIRHEHFES